MSRNAMIAIVVLIAAVAAVAAAAVLMSGGNSDQKNPEPGPGTYDPTKNAGFTKPVLPVFGNADGNSVIDDADVQLIRKMISENTPLSSYPFADADRDGTVSEKDAGIVSKIISNQSTDLWFMDQYDLVAGEYRFVKVSYPLRNLVTQNADMLLLTMMIDADDKVAGYIANIDNYPNEFYKVTHNNVSKSLGNTARYIAPKDWEAIKNLDVELGNVGGIGAILVHSESALGDYKNDILAAGIPLVYLRCTDPVYSMDAALLLGTLLGTENAVKAKDYADECGITVKSVSNAVSKVSEADKKRFISLCMICYIAQSESQYTSIGIQAGGKEMSGLEGNTSVRLQSVEAITQYNGKIDRILNCTTKDCVPLDPAVLWEDQDIRYLEKSSSFQDMIWVNMSMPISCRVMYVASVFYPDIISPQEADEYFQMTVDKYMSYLHKTVDDGFFDVKTDMFTLIDYQDYLDSKGGEIPPEKVDSEYSAIAMANHFVSALDLTQYNGNPYTVEGDDQKASVLPQSGKYYVNYTLYEDAESVYKTAEAEYLGKIGTESAMGGTYTKIDSESGLEEGIGYYVNVPGKIGSMYYAGYIEKCFVELHLARTPELSAEDLENIVSAIVASDSSVSAIEAAKKFDLSLLSGMANAPFSVTGDDMKASVQSELVNGRQYYITYDSNSSASIDFETKKAEFKEKDGTSYMGGVRMAITECGFDDGFGFYGNTDRGFSMIQYVGCKDGCYVDIYLRMNNAEFTQESAEAIVKAAAQTIG